MYTYGLEALNFNAKSALAEHLEQLFQDCLDFVATSEYGTLRNNSTYKDIVSKLKYRWLVSGEYGKRLEQIVKNDLGFSGIRAIATYLDCQIIPFDISPDDKQLYNGYANVYVNTGELSWNNIIKRCTNTAESQKFLIAFKAIGNSFDPITGKFMLNDINYDAMRRIALKPIIGLPVDKLFVPKPDTDISTSKPFTARELTAIYLHEFGHVVDKYVRVANNGIVSNLVYNCGRDLIYDSIKSFSLPDQAVLNELRSTASIINNKTIEYCSINKDSTIVAFAAKMNKQTISLCDKLIKYRDQLSSDMSDEVSVLVIVGIILFWLVLFYFYTSLCLLVIAICIGKFIFSDVMATMLSRKDLTSNYTVVENQKRNEVAASQYTLSSSERTADNMAVRFGYGADLISALAKINHVAYKSTTPNTGCTLLDVGVMTVMNCIQLIPTLAFPFTEDNIHREGVRRIQSIINESNRYFKLYNDSDDTAFSKQMLASIDKLRKFLNDAEHAKLNTITVRVVSFLYNKILNWDYLSDFLLTGHMSDEYTKLFEQVDNLIGNDLYYWSEKFKVKNFDANNYMSK